MKIYEYKGYKAKIIYSKEDNLYYGELINTKDTSGFVEATKAIMIRTKSQETDICISISELHF